MTKYSFLFLLVLFTDDIASGQEKVTVVKDLQKDWMKFEEGRYIVIGDDGVNNTVYVTLGPAHFPGSNLLIQSARPFYFFMNGKLCGQYEGRNFFKMDSLAGYGRNGSLLIAIHQKDINPRDLKTAVVAYQKNYGEESLLKPKTYFNDFVIVSGLIITILFLVIMRINPKLTSDYLSVTRIFSVRDADDAQSNARITSSSNIQFFIICSLLLGFYLLIILYHLPDEYALPVYFRSHNFWTAAWQWVKLSSIILFILFAKLLLVFSLTRLFGMRGLTRVHFFNWVKLLLITIGTFSIILFVYYISRGQNANIFIIFMTLVVIVLMTWIFIVYLKLSSKSEHSMFHLFSYICATELIPLLITIKVLFH
jgi:hypothetical protein